MLEPKLRAAELRNLYASNPRVDKAHMLIISKKGAGKTSLAKTCPTPVLVMSFDPGGTTVLRAEIESGDILVDTRYEQDNPKTPTAYWAFKKELSELELSGFLNSIGTFILDSTTTLSTSIIWQILKKEGRILPPMDKPLSLDATTGKGMRLQDWGTLLDEMQMITRMMTTFPCHTIMLGHIGEDKDEVTKSFVKTILVPGKSKDFIPILVPEFYYLETYNSKDGPQRRLQTQTDSNFSCTTRMGGGKFDKFEPANIRDLLKKAGMSFQDNEPL